MQLTITGTEGQVSQIDVAADMSVDDLMALCSAELGLQSLAHNQLTLTCNGHTIKGDDKRTLQSHGLTENSLVLVSAVRANPAAPTHRPVHPARAGHFNMDWSAIQVPGPGGSSGNGNVNRPHPVPAAAPSQQAQMDARVAQSVRDLQAEFVRSAELRDRLQAAQPDLYNALRDNDNATCTRLVLSAATNQMEQHMERMRTMANPMSADAQRLIEKEIQEQNIQHTYETAIEHTPEVFGTVHMLYVECKVNGKHMKAFVDSGAQMTIISSQCATECDLLRLVDKRFQGLAMGVGTQKIIGRIHAAQLEIAGGFLPVTFSVMEDQKMDIILGLDMLKRHQCCLDLKDNRLLIGTTGGYTPFLGEADLPLHARLNGKEDDAGPSVSEDAQLAEAMQKSANEHTTATTASDSKEKSATATPSTANGTAVPMPGDQDKVQQLKAMGFSEQDAMQALTEAQGNVQQAAVTLLTKALPKP